MRSLLPFWCCECARDDGAPWGRSRAVVGWIDVGALPIASRAERDEVEVYG